MHRSRKKRKRVIFPSRIKARQQMMNRQDDIAKAATDGGSTIEEIIHRTTVSETNMEAIPGHEAVPSLFTSPPPIKDILVTETSIQQEEVVEDCIPLLAGAIPGKSTFDFSLFGVPRLERADHVRWLRNYIETAKSMLYDASRPWIVYWCLTGLSLLGEDVQHYSQRVTETFSPAQNPSGGFGGGHGHQSHLAPSYAVILSLAMVGGEESLNLVDRRSLWRWLGQVKQANGGFCMCKGGEEDVRGAYCAMVMISLLSLPLDLPPDAPARKGGLTTFVDQLPEYLSRCQSFEGGLSGSPQMTEAHGGYAFCALACLCILGPPQKMLPEYLDLPSLLSWMSSRQYAPEGGYSGRTNKLVDGCYSHWVGAAWTFIEAALRQPPEAGAITRGSVGHGLYSKEGLIRYVLSCCQAESGQGGLRDKPNTGPDGYHTCYTLAGLSYAQHSSTFDDAAQYSSANGLAAPFGWVPTSRPADQGNHHTERSTEPAYDIDDNLQALHPIYVIPWDAVEQTRAFYTAKLGF